MKFDDFTLVPSLQGFLAESKITEPSEVQAQVIPKFLEKKSLMVVAQTGTGKTLSYALPIVSILKQCEEKDGIYLKRGKPQAVIIAPTKELALQIHNVFKSISHHSKIRARLLVGGMNMGQINVLGRQSFDVLVSTPNKLVSALKVLDLENLEFLVFDEADTLFEMGFQKDIEKVVRRVDYQETLISFFSATLPTSVEVFITEKFHKAGLEKIMLDSSHKVQQRIETFNMFVSDKEKLPLTHAFINKTAVGRGIVFANQKNQVEEISAYLKEKNPQLKLITIHGDQEAADRLKNIKKFTNGKAQVLVASDVVARGIDVTDLQWVFNYNLPKNAEFYLHRSGRVGRMNKKGLVYNLITERDAKLIALINDSIKSQSSLNLDTIAKNISEVRKRKKKVKKKQKRVKITKRSRR